MYVIRYRPTGEYINYGQTAWWAKDAICAYIFDKPYFRKPPVSRTKFKIFKLKGNAEGWCKGVISVHSRIRWGFPLDATWDDYFEIVQLSISPKV
jgi:hypothetical protein